MLTTTFLVATLGLGTAWAQPADPNFQGTKKEEEIVEKPVHKLSIEVGGALATGNTQTYTLNSKLNYGMKYKANGLVFNASSLIGAAVLDLDVNATLSDEERDEGFVQNALRFTVDGRYDRFFGKQTSLYFFAGFLSDKFAGFDTRTNQQFGISRSFVKNEKLDFLGELGADFAQENYVLGVDPNFRPMFAARVMLSFKYNFNEFLGFEETAELYSNIPDFEDQRFYNKFGFTAKATKILTFKVGHNLIFDNQPVDGFRKLDQTTMVTIVASIL